MVFLPSLNNMHTRIIGQQSCRQVRPITLSVPRHFSSWLHVLELGKLFVYLIFTLITGGDYHEIYVSASQLADRRGLPLHVACVFFLHPVTPMSAFMTVLFKYTDSVPSPLHHMRDVCFVFI
jgi:hypothetical protein